MPMIAELREIDGALWARVPLTEGSGRIQILSDAEVTQNDARLARLLSEIEALRAQNTVYRGAIETILTAAKAARELNDEQTQDRKP